VVEIHNYAKFYKLESIIWSNLEQMSQNINFS